MGKIAAGKRPSTVPGPFQVVLGPLQVVWDLFHAVPGRSVVSITRFWSVRKIPFHSGFLIFVPFSVYLCGFRGVNFWIFVCSVKVSRGLIISFEKAMVQSISL